MRKYVLIKTSYFKKKFNKLSSDVKNVFEKHFEKLIINPFGIGKPLGNKWIRELKHKKFRVYYVIYEKELFILVVGSSDKKDQSHMINYIKTNRFAFKVMMENIKKYKLGLIM
jgi:mRNA-degrading endonuclease RelE of RelBE toxin-antitoxin system